MNIYLYIYFVLIFTSTINICGEKKEQIIEAKIFICPFRPHYTGFSNNPWVSGKHNTEKKLGKKLGPDTLLQEVWIWSPGKFNRDKKQIPSYLPVELLPKKEGDSLEIILKGKIFRLTADQKNSRYSEDTFEKMLNYYLDWVKDQPNVNKEDVEGLIEMGVLNRDPNSQELITGPNNKYFKQQTLLSKFEDQTTNNIPKRSWFRDLLKFHSFAFFSLTGASLTALGLFAWWKKWFKPEAVNQ